MTTQANDLPKGEPLIRPSSTDHPLYEIVEACRTVYDPEIPVNIYDLGLVYTIEIIGRERGHHPDDLTAPGCPVAGEMPGWVADAVEPVEGVQAGRCASDLGAALGHGHDERRGAAGTGLHSSDVRQERTPCSENPP
jgi:metal-sulfur cluster biosynthetic enzyme